MAIQFMESFQLFTGDWVTGPNTLLAGRGWSGQTASGNSHLVVQTGSGRFGTGRTYFNVANNVEYAQMYRTVPTRSKIGVVFSVYYSTTGQQDGTVRLYESGTLHIDLRWNGTNFFVTRNGATLATGTTSISTSTWYGVEMWTEIADAGGVVKVWINGAATPDINYSGDTRNGGSGVINTVYFRSYQASGAGTVNRPSISDIVLYDDQGSVNNVGPLGDIRVEPLRPTGAGSSTQWTPNAGANWDRLDEAPHDSDTSYVVGDTIGEKDTYALGNLASTTGAVPAVQVTAVARKNDAGSRSIETIVRSSGGTEDQGGALVLGTAYAATQRILESEPGGSGWTTTAANGAEAGLIVTV